VAQKSTFFGGNANIYRIWTSFLVQKCKQTKLSSTVNTWNNNSRMDLPSWPNFGSKTWISTGHYCRYKLFGVVPITTSTLLK